MPECNEPCAGLTRLERQLEDLKAQNSTSHEKIYDRLCALETSDAVQNEHYDVILEKIDGLSEQNTNLINKVELLEQKPAKRWEKMMDKIISAAAGAIVMYILAHLGLV